MSGKLGAKRIDWSIWEHDVCGLYDKNLSVRQIYDRLVPMGFSATMNSIRGFIVKRYGLENLSGGTRENWGPNRAPRIFAQKICKSCLQNFDPTNPQQRWCLICAPSKEWVARLVRYNISKPAWDNLLKKQSGHCALCEREATKVDHDHVTGRIRGLLCNGCNFALSRIDEKNGWVERALIYTTGIKDAN